MKPPRSRADALEQLARSFVAAEQLKLRERLEKGDARLRDILDAYVNNPFLRLTDEEAAALAQKVRPAALGQLIAARHAATRSTAPKHAVFCMPKSGSSFLQSAVQHALELPFVSLTAFSTQRVTTYFGGNSREQELDEAAIIKAAASSPVGYVAQHHTRYSTYLGLQLQLFQIMPMVSVRNIPDSIVSFDDMLLQTRGDHHAHPWVGDPQFALPPNYTSLPDEARHTLLAHAFGVWLINFYLSWKRGRGQGLVAPLLIRYEEDILAPDRLVERLAMHLRATPAQKDRLAAYVRAPDRTASRFNVGRRGRGAEKLGEPIRQFLGDYARLFEGELTAEEIAYLVG